jgi:nitric oxide reductase activation protein
MKCYPGLVHRRGDGSAPRQRRRHAGARRAPAQTHLARLSLALDQYHGRPYGDDIDIDATIDAQVQARASSTPDKSVYINSLRCRRDLSVLILLDISRSAGG